MTLEEILSRRAELNEAKRAIEWSLADQAAQLVREYGRNVLSEAATLDRSTTEKVANQARVAAAFPEEYRHPDIPWDFYLTVLKAAKRLDKPPIEVLEMALTENMSAKDLNKLGKQKREVAKLSKTCEWCGAKVRVEHEQPGTKILCPVCRELGRESTLGLLE
jgi:hypothetical protein